MISINKRIVYYFFLCIYVAAVFTSCKTTSKSTSTPAKPEVQKPPVTKPSPPIEQIGGNKNEVLKIKVALIMPFELEQNFSDGSGESVEPVINQSSLSALNFYEGAMLAADSLKSKKKDVKLFAYDTPADSAGIARMLFNPAIQDASIVIGTFPNNLAPAASLIAKKAGINLVLTQAATPDILLNNKNVTLAYASTITQCREMVSYMMGMYPESNVILVFRNNKREDELAAVYRQEILLLKKDSDFKDLNATEKNPADIIKLISKTKRNLVFITSSDEAFVSLLLSNMESQNIFGIIVGGLPTWQNFESIDFMNFKNIQVHIFDNNFISPDNTEDIVFRKNFLNVYFNDPLPTAFNGFELVYKLAENFEQGKSEFPKVISKAFNYDSEYRFKEINPTGGLENSSISVLKFNDYKLERLNK